MQFLWMETLGNLGDIIDQAQEDGDEWRVSRLQRMAQTEFNLVVIAEGGYNSPYDDINLLYAEYLTLGKPAKLINRLQRIPNFS